MTSSGWIDSVVGARTDLDEGSRLCMKARMGVHAAWMSISLSLSLFSSVGVGVSLLDIVFCPCPVPRGRRSRLPPCLASDRAPRHLQHPPPWAIGVPQCCKTESRDVGADVEGGW